MGTWTPGAGPTSGDDTFVGDGTGETADGGAGNDILSGNGGNDTLIGGTGDDTLYGGDGDDALLSNFPATPGNLGTDYYDGGAGIDTIYYWSESAAVTVNLTTGTAVHAGITDTLIAIENVVGSNGGDDITGDNGANILYGYNGADTLRGGQGNDTLIGGSGANIHYGGAGDDLYVVESTSDTFFENVGEGTDTIHVEGLSLDAATIDLSAFANIERYEVTRRGGAGVTLIANAENNVIVAGVDSFHSSMRNYGSPGAGGIYTIYAGAGNDAVSLTTTYSTAGAAVFYGEGGDDTLTGNTGNDYLNGGTGNDTMAGGGGNDTYAVDSISDVVVEGAGGGVDTIETSLATYTLGTELENLTYTGSSNFTGTGNASANTITGGSVYNTISGGAGDDVLYGQGLNDTLNGDDGNDTLFGGGGNDTLAGGEGNDVLYGGFHDDFLQGGAGNDTLYGESGDDGVFGGAGADTMVGGVGNDSYSVDNVGDIVVENAGEGTDTVSTTLASFVLPANLEILYGGNGAGQTLAGNAASNQIYGSSGADVITGGAGNDAIDGWTGQDAAVFSGQRSDYTITRVSTGVYTVQDLRGGAPDGLDTLTNVELAQFSDLTASFISLAPAPPIVGTNGPDTLSGGSEDELMYGLDGDDIMDGAGGADQIDGGAGNDTIIGGNGNDRLIGGYGENTLNGGAGTDSADYSNFSAVLNLSTGIMSYPSVDADLFRTTNQVVVGGGYFAIDQLIGVENLIGSPTNDSLQGDQNANVLDGGSNDDYLSGRGGDDTLIGGDGADTLDGGIGVDMLIGGTGNDTYFVGEAGDVVAENANEGVDFVVASLSSYTLGANVENLQFVTIGSAVGTGNALANGLTGDVGDDTLSGLGGDDTLDGRAGADTLIGGAGNDTLIGGAGSDIAVFSGARANYQIAQISAHVYSVTDLRGGSPDGVDIINGIEFAQFSDGTIAEGAFIPGGATSGDDVLVGTAGNDTIDGLAGNDQISGLGGNDVLTGGLGDDVVYGGDGNDTLVGGDGHDTLDGGAGVDTADYSGFASAIGVYLAIGSGDEVWTRDGPNVTSGTWRGIADVANVESVIGTAYDDFLSTNAATTNFSAGGGDDTLEVHVRYAGAPLLALDGGANNAGGDTVTFADFYAGAWVSLNYNGYEAWTRDTTNVDTGTWRAIADIANVENIVGSAYDDYLRGSTGANVISYTGGLDVIDGDAGNDTVDFSRFGSAVWVALSYNGYEAWTRGTTNVDTGTWRAIADISNVENLTGTSYDDYLRGSSGANTLTGAAGNDMLEGGGGADVLNGGQGVDTASYALSAAAVTVDLSTGSVSGGDAAGDTFVSIENLIGSAFADSLTGTSGDNFLYGGAGGDTLDGGGGNDVLDGGAGIDTLIGGAGNDTYTADASDIIVEAPGGGYDVANVNTGNYTYAMADNVEEAHVSATPLPPGIITYVSYGVLGNALDNVIIGDNYDSIINGGIGADTMSGNGGNDTYYVDNAGDVVVEGANGGTDRIISAISLTLANNVEELLFTGNANLVGVGNAGNNTIYANSGSGTYYGGDGDDKIFGNGGVTGDVMYGGNGNDILQVQSGTNTLYGEDGDDYLVGGHGDDTLYGGAGNDRFSPGLGHNILDGGAGVNTVIYSNTTAIIVDLAAVDQVVAVGGYFSDRLINIQNIIFTNYDDTQIFRTIAPGAVLNFDGAGGQDTANFEFFASAVWVDLTFNGTEVWTRDTTNLNTGTYRPIVDLANVESVTGSAYDDYFAGDAANNSFRYIGGHDVIDGRGGSAGVGDTVDFSGFSSAVWVDLGIGAADEAWTRDGANVLTGAWRAIADISNVERVIGTSFDDQLFGVAGTTALSGGAGDDLLVVRTNTAGTIVALNGGAGASDTADFSQFGAAVWINLDYNGYEGWTRDNASVTTGTWRAMADIAGVENVVGTAFDDFISGDANANRIFYTGGRDSIDGFLGNDTVDFSRFGSAVWVSLDYAGDEAWTRDTANVNTGTWRAIADITRVENITGSAYDDDLRGDSGANRIEGGAGNDSLIGGGGADVFLYRGGAGNVINGGHDLIVDFVRGTDHIEIDTALSSGAAGAALHIDNTGADSHVTFDGSPGLLITIAGVDLDQSDFLFT